MTFFTLEQIAELTQSLLVAQADYIITNLEDLESATSSDASFLANPRYEQQMRKSKAGVIFVTPHQTLIEGKNFLINQNPSRAFQILLEAFYPEEQRKSGFVGIHPTAVIHETASVDHLATIGPHAVIDRGVKIGAHTVISAGVFVGAYAEIGENCFIHPRVIIRERCFLGKRVVIQPGAVIGSCGFGYTTEKDGKHTSLKQVGNVVIEDDVEIGANTTIDRARFKTTRIGRGTKIDNLVQIAHGVVIGEDNLIVAQVGVAGSSKTGRNVTLAGQSAVVGHVQIADNTIVAARGAVTKSLPTGIFSGAPAIPLKEFNEQVIHVRNLGKLTKRILRLEKILEEKYEKEPC